MQFNREQKVRQASCRFRLRFSAGLPTPIITERALYVFQNEVANGYEDERNEGGEKHTPCEADAHGNYELSLGAFLEHGGQDAAEGGEACQQDRPEACTAGIAHGLE